MLRRCILLLITLALTLLMAPLAAAPPPAQVARIGVLTLGTAPSTPRAEAFRQGLQEHGYVEGRNLAVEYRYAEGKADRFPALAAELVRLQVDLLVTESNVAALAAKQATHTLPIVAIAGDLAQAGVVDSLARPGGNVTGLTLMHPELSGKRLELLKEAVPTLDRVAVLWNPTDPPP
jgi:putative tryptophan/tyrosine transport system substrate-binding protein